MHDHVQPMVRHSLQKQLQHPPANLFLLLANVSQLERSEHASVQFPQRKSSVLVHLFPSPGATYFILSYITPIVYEVML